MASKFNRGTRDNPKWYAVYAAGTKPDGKTYWRQKVVPAEIRFASEAQRWADQYERDYAAGNVQSGAQRSSSSLIMCGTLMDTWEKSLTNRSAATDRSRIAKHVRPAFADIAPQNVRPANIMTWLDAQRAHERRLSEATIRHNLNLLSRFFSWCIERGHAENNPVRAIPQRSRPQLSPKKNVAYLTDDVQVRAIYHALVAPVDVMFYLGHTSGLRLGEICGLRISDLDHLDKGVIRASHSYDGPLKEDKNSVGISKLVPAPADAATTLEPYLNRRLAEGAKPGDYLFENRMKAPKMKSTEEVKPRHFRKEYVDKVWRRALIRLGMSKVVEPPGGAPTIAPYLTFYEATRHSFVSRLQEAGNADDEISRAVGHSSVAVTKRHYMHFTRQTYSPTMRFGVDLAMKVEAAATIIPLPRSIARV